MDGSRRFLVVLLPLIFALAAPAAQAKTYCVNFSPCPAGGIPKATPEDAIDGVGGSDANPDADVIRIGPGTFSQPNLTANEEVDIVGSGIGRTTLVPNLGLTGLLQLIDSNSSVSDLSITLPYDGFFSAIRFQNGADAARVRIVSTSDSFTNSGFVAEDGGTALDGVQTDLGTAPTGSAVSFFDGGGLLTDSTIIGGIGVSPSGPITSVVRRSTIRASDGVRVFGGVAVARNVVVTPHPRDTTGQFSDAVSATAGNGGENASLTGSHLTLVGPGPTDGNGVASRANNCCATGVATVNLTNSVIRGFQTPLLRQGLPAPQAANLTVSYSAFGPPVNGSGNGTQNLATGNIASNPDPKFVSSSRGDYRLRFDSPLRDKGAPGAQAGDSEGDRNGRTRIRDSDGVGGARRDMGAFEYQRLPPVVAFTFSPAQPLIGAPVTFAGSATDPDADPVAYGWSFGDGATAAGKTVSHGYGSAGAKQARLTALDPLGLAGTTVRTVPVVAPPSGPSLLPGACANRRAGGPGKDRLVGTAFGDRLLGGRGNDRLSGGGGKDCLGGGRGNDRVSGGTNNDRVGGDSGNDRLGGDSGNDRLSGGSGRDRLNGGRGRDRMSGGSGNDRITAGGGDRVSGGSGNDAISARNRRRDRIDCGSGRRDRVRADRRDRLRRCERVSRR